MSLTFRHMIFFYGTLHLFQHIPRRLSVKTLHENRPAVNEIGKGAKPQSVIPRLFSRNFFPESCRLHRHVIRLFLAMLLRRL